ncbi:hypothetical protein [Leifsonia sp. 22587]|uniref:hypothetical protein n=1 Tax=Leifsonia sp. 22587 TaxID=3453946 RepID=UPI003F82BD94
MFDEKEWTGAVVRRGDWERVIPVRPIRGRWPRSIFIPGDGGWRERFDLCAVTGNCPIYEFKGYEPQLETRADPW